MGGNYGYAAESGVPICPLPIRVVLQSWRGVICVFTSTNGKHVFCSPYSSRFLYPQCNEFPTARTVLCASVQHSMSFVPQHYNGVTHIAGGERVRHTCAGDTIHAQIAS